MTTPLPPHTHPAHGDAPASSGAVSGYDVLMVDPPWTVTLQGQRTSPGHEWQQYMPYDTLSVDDIAALLVREVLPLACPTHTVFLWTTESHLRAAEDMMQALGYRRHIRIVWDKVEGNAPAFTLRWTHEYLLWLYKPRLMPVVDAAQGKYASVIRGGRRQHSRKPEAAYALVEALYPDARRLDVFTREFRENWDGWGDQRDHFTPLFAGLRESEVGA